MENLPIQTAECRILADAFSQKDLSSLDESFFMSSEAKTIFSALKELIENDELNEASLYQGVINRDPQINKDLLGLVLKGNDEPVNDAIRTVKSARTSAKMLDILMKANTKLEKGVLTKEEKNEVQALLIAAEDELTSDKHEEAKLASFEEIYKRYIVNFDQREFGKQYRFMNWLFDDLIEEGPAPGQIGILTSSSGSGKSTVCANVIASCIEMGIPTAYFSLEMSEMNTIDRMIAKRLHIPFKKLQNPGEEFEDIKVAIQRVFKDYFLKKTNFVFSDSPDLSVRELERLLKKLMAKNSWTYMIVFIDLLSMMKDFCGSIDGANFAQVAEIGINALSAVAKRCGIHIVGVLQQNRANEADVKVHCVEDLDKLRPSRAQIKNAGAYLERARYVISCFRPKSYAELYLSPDEVALMDDIVELTCVKQNNGDLGKTVKALFVGECFDIRPIIDYSNRELDMDTNEIIPRDYSVEEDNDR